MLKKAEAERKLRLAKGLEQQRAEREEKKKVRVARAKQHVRTMHSGFLQAAENRRHRQTSMLEGHFVELGWQENAGSAQCELCNIVTKRHHLVCPVSSAVGCDDCVTKLSLYKRPSSVSDKAATQQWSNASKGKGKKRAYATLKAAGAPQGRRAHDPFSVLGCDEDVVEEAEATTPENHSRPEQPQATSAAGNSDLRKDIPKAKPTTISSGRAKLKRIPQIKEIKTKATATHATPRMPQSRPQPKPAINIKEVKTEASTTYAAFRRPQ